MQKFSSYLQASLCIIIQPNHFPQLVPSQIINKGNGKFVAITPCRKCHVQNKLTGLTRLYEGIG